MFRDFASVTEHLKDVFSIFIKITPFYGWFLLRNAGTATAPAFYD